MDWRHDARGAIADELVKAGHAVDHVQPDGTLHKHEAGQPFSDWLIQEEEKLRKVEKMRNSGELQRKTKSAVDRSTESVAMKLHNKPAEIDTMSMLRDATNQQELKFAQRHLAATQRYAEKYELPSKVLAGAPQFIVKEARMQAAWVDERKKEKSVLEPSQKVDADHCLHENDEYTCDFQVECRICNCFYSWSELLAGDGCCVTCSGQKTSVTDVSSLATTCLEEEASSSAPSSSGACSAEVLLVECAACGSSFPWSLLAVGDGVCPACVSRSSAQDSSTAAAAEEAEESCKTESVVHVKAVSSNARWQRHSSSRPHDQPPPETPS